VSVFPALEIMTSKILGCRCALCPVPRALCPVPFQLVHSSVYCDVVTRLEAASDQVTNEPERLQQ